MLNTDSLIVPLVQYIWHDNNKDYIQKDIKIIENIRKIDQLVVNKKNIVTLRKFLGNIHTPLRYSYLLDTKILISFVKIIKFFDLPFRFDLDKKFLWRYYATPYGAYFDKKKRSFVSFFSMGLKKNIGVLMPFLLNYPSHSNLLHAVDWHKFSLLFKSSLINYNGNGKKNFSSNTNFFPVNDFEFNLIPISKHILSKRFHRSINLSDIDIDPWLSTFDYRFWTHDVYDLNYKISNLSKVDYIWGVHSSFVNSSFFISSFDTRIILYPELYFKYLSKNYTIIKILKNIKFFKRTFNVFFYSKMLNLFESFYKNNINNVNNKLTISKNYNVIKFFKSYNVVNYKLNNINIKKFILFYVIFNKNLFNRENILYLKKSLYLFKPSKLIKRIFLRNYFYYRSRKYERKPVKYNFRLFYLKKFPIGRINKIRSFPIIYWKTKLRTIFYRNYRKFLFFRMKKFWNYFFSFFLQNIKKRFFFFNMINNFDNTNIKSIYDNYIYDLLFFLKKFFFFNRYLKKYFNLYNFNKIIKNDLQKNKKKIIIDYKNISIYINKFLRSKNLKKKDFILNNYNNIKIIKNKFNNIKYKY